MLFFWPASVSGRSDGESSFPVSYLQGVTRSDNLLRAAYRVLFTRRCSLRQPSRSNRSCLVYKALFTTRTFPEQSTVSCLQGVIHYDNLRLFFTNFSEQPTVSYLQGVIHYDNLVGGVPVSCLQGDIHYKIQAHKKFKRTLFIRTKYNTRIFGVIPLIKLSNDT